MHRKLVTLIPALLLFLTTWVAPITVAAQGLMGSGKILVAVGVSTTEVLELYVGPIPSLPSVIPQDRVFFNYHLFANATALGLAPGEKPCTETLQFTVPAHRGLTVLNIRMGEGNDSLLINEEEEEFTEGCMMKAKRVYYEMGLLPRSQQNASGRIFDAELGIQPIYRYGHAIVGLNGETRAAGFTATVNHLKSKGGAEPN